MAMQNVDRIHRRQVSDTKSNIDLETLRPVLMMSSIGLTISLFIVSLLMR